MMWILFYVLVVVVGLPLIYGYNLSNLTISTINDRYKLYCKEKLHDCSANGRCLLEKCICNPGWTGEFCSVPVDYAVGECVPLQCFYDKVDPECVENCPTGYFCNSNCTDACHYHPEYGVMTVPRVRWELAQHSELNLWVEEVTDNDRSDYHQHHFQNYAFLPTKHLGNVLEIASGPFTQLKTILSVTEASVDSITLLEPQVLQYMQSVANCSYKDGKLLGHPITFIVGGAEALSLGEVFDTVVMINGIEHVQDAVAVLNNLYHSIKPGGYLIWHEEYFENYTAKPFQYFNDLHDFIFHPIRIRKSLFQWFLTEHFTTVYLATDAEVPSIHNPGIYFIGRKPLTDQGWEYVVNERN